MTESNDRRLHRYHDDDLSPEEKAALAEELATLPPEAKAELGKKLEGLREIGVVLRAARTDDAPIDSDALWKGIEGQLGASAPAEAHAKPALRAIEGGASRAPSAATPPNLADRRRRVIGIAVGAFALAAAALLMIYGPSGGGGETVAEDTTPDTDSTETTPDTTTPDEQTDEVVASASDYTEVLAVDFGTNVGTIFAVEGEGGQRYAVVWLDDVLKNDDLERSEEQTTTDTPN